MSDLYSDVEFMLRRSASASRLEIDRTLKSFAKTLKKFPEGTVYQKLPPRVKYNLCCSRIMQGDFSQWSGWEFRADDGWAAIMRYGIKDIPFWDGNYTESLVIIGEQGIGDEVLWASLIPEAMLRCKEVTYACDGRLVETIKRSFGIQARQRFVTAEEDLLEGNTAYIPGADLLTLFRKTRGHFPKKPFLKINEERLGEMEKYRGRVGISWRGRHGYLNPKDLGIENPLSLQYDELRFDGSEAIERPHIDLRNDIEGVIALISVLEKVVCVPTSVYHFAGAIGKKAEIILPSVESELHTDGGIDEIDWHVPVGQSYFYPNQQVFKTIKEWKCHT